MKSLHLADNLELPVSSVTQAIGILAKRRAGKSYTARRLAEQFHAAGQQLVIVDPKGDWWGIRSSANGKAAGLPIVILGGEHGDVPLEVESGEVVAKLVVEEAVSILLDLSFFRKHEVATFMAAFLETLYRLKAREKYRTPVMLIIDEADAIAPQKPQPNEARMLGAAEDIVRRGGQRGIGVSMITQRSAVLNKNVLTQIQILVALRTIAPQDLKAINEWVDVHGTEEERKLLMESLPNLPVGDAWFWSPGWPTSHGIFKRAHVLPITTFDSGASPEPGSKPVEPRNLAEVDLEALKRNMAETIQRAKADDPKELKKEIAKLKNELAAACSKVELLSSESSSNSEAIAEAARAQAEQTKKNLAALRTLLITTAESFKLAAVAVGEDFINEVGNYIDSTEAAAQIPQVNTILARRVPVRDSGKIGTHPFPAPAATSSQSGPLPSGEMAILKAVCQFNGADKAQLTVLTGYKRSSRDAYIARLKQKGLVSESNGMVLPTDAAMAIWLPLGETLPTGRALQEYWQARLPKGEWDILSAVINKGVCSREYISQQTGFKRSSRDAYISRLKAKKLVEDAANGCIRASAHLLA